MNRVKLLFQKSENKLTIAIIVICIVAIGGYGGSTYLKNRNFKSYILQADNDYNKDKFSEAKIYYEKALSCKDDSSIKKKITLCSKMEKSQASFDCGTSYLNTKDYLDAYKEFKQVIPQDKKYKIAKEKADQSAILYMNDEISKAKDAASKSEYLYAISLLDSSINFSSDNNKVINLQSQTKALKSQYQSQQSQFDNENKQKLANSTTTIDAPTPQVKLTSEDGDLELENKYCSNGYICGTIKNLSSDSYSYVEVDINLFDASGNQVDSTLTNVNNLAANTNWNFKAPVINQDNVSTYKVVSIQGTR